MRFVSPLVFVLAACGSTSTSSPTVNPTTSTESVHDPGPAPAGVLPEGVTPVAYRLELTIAPDEPRFSGQTEIDVQLEHRQQLIWFHGKNLEVQEATVVVEGEEPIAATYEQHDDQGVASLRLAEPAGPGEATIRIRYDAPFDEHLNGLYRVEEGEHAYAFTQMEATHARTAFPSFDEPRFKTPFDVTLTVALDHVAAANTAAEHEEAVGEMKRIRYRRTEPLPTYLIAFAVGPFDVVEGTAIPANDVRERPLPFRGLAVRGKGEQLAYALAETGAQVRFLEEYFGMPYPYDKLDIVAVPDFEAGAMENVGLVTFREWLLLVNPETATEGQKRAFAYVMAHELAHMWFGNLVTMPWWDDLWLNESFATWMGNKVVRHLYPGYGAELSHLEGSHRAMGSDSLSTARQIRQPIESNHDIRNAFDRITYSKGGAVLEMFELFLGEEKFRDGLRIHMRRHAHGNATADDLLRSLSEAAESDVAAPFRTFLFQPGVPFVDFEVHCEAEQAELRGAQRRYLPVGSPGSTEQSWQLPLCVRSSFDGNIQQTCGMLTPESPALAFESGCPDWVMPNANGAGYFRFALPAEDLSKLRNAGWDHLSPRERMAVADSITASFDSAATNAADLFPMMDALATDPTRQVATAPMGIIGFVNDYIVDDRAKPRLRRYASRLYSNRFRQLGWTPRAGEAGDDRLLRASVLGFLAGTARDSRIRRDAVRRAKAYVSFGDEPAVDPGAVDTNLAGTVLSVAVNEEGAPFFDHLEALLFSSTDAPVRNRVLGALGSARDPELAARARNLALDERLRTNEVMQPLWGQSQGDETRAALGTWFTENYDQLATRISPGRLGGTPWLFSSLCTEEEANAVQAFFAERIDEIPGGPRNLAGSVEGIRLCAARAEAQGESARSFF
ncbi:MAG: M1 family aminopeptidase [Myxococcota bacterium]